MVVVTEMDMYLFLIQSFRYSVKRDNHLAPGICIELIKKYLPALEGENLERTRHKLIEEIKSEISFQDGMKKPLEYKKGWLKLLEFLVEYKEPYRGNKIKDYKKREWEEISHNVYKYKEHVIQVGPSETRYAVPKDAIIGRLNMEIKARGIKN